MNRYLLIALLLFGSACADSDLPIIDREEAPPGQRPLTVQTSPSAAGAASPVASSFQQIEVAHGLKIPLAIVFAKDGRVFFAEAKEGNVRVIDPVKGLLPEPVAHFDVSQQGEFGLVGLALDPSFSDNRRMYAYLTDPNPDGSAKGNRVARMVVNNNRAEDITTIIGDIPPSGNKHVAGRMAFGSDAMLYVAIGDTQRPDQAMDPNSVVGKILRVTTDGTAAPNNPFPGSRAFAVGFRNPFGIAFDPGTGRLFGVDNGPTTFDEVNIIEAGGNYGHPTAWGPSGGRFKEPVWNSGHDSHGMSGITVVRASPIAGLRDRVLFCSFDNTTLHSLRLMNDGSVGPDEPITSVACSLDVAASPEGIVYVAHGDKIIKLIPS
ncbi:MAG: PQQ-dependent sugar dehydrogenase [Actinomycetota bacterium]